MPRHRADQEGSLKEGIGQRWVLNSYDKSYSDQFGFMIRYGTEYRLSFKGQDLITVYSLITAKLISTIILNDIIMNKKIGGN